MRGNFTAPGRERNRETHARPAGAHPNRAERRKAAREVRRRTVGLHVNPSPWATNDRMWFAEHPHRSHRVRARFPGEFFVSEGDAPDVDMVVVRQIEPGFRTRTPFELPPSPFKGRFLTAAETEGGAHAMFELTQGSKAEFRCSEVEAFINQYSNAGAA